MSQLSFKSVEKIEKIKEVAFVYRIETPYKSYSSTEYYICDVNCSTEELEEKCKVWMKKRLNGLFDGDDCVWKVRIMQKRKI